MKHFLSQFAIALVVLSCSSSNDSIKTDSDQEVTETMNTAETFGHEAFDWLPTAMMYEVNLRQYSEEGSLRAFSKHLPRLKEMGVDILWFMPIHPIGEKNRKGGMGSYYSIKDYKAIDPMYGTVEEFKVMVAEAHDMGMKVVIDWVANHSAWDNVWVDQGHVDWYTPDSAGNMQPPIGTDWWDVADLDYDNKEMRAAMIDAMVYWVRECNIDGFRCDVAGWVPLDFWAEARLELDKIKPTFMLAESEDEGQMDEVFHMNYAWDLHHRMNLVARHEKGADHLAEYWNDAANKFKGKGIRLNFTSNHDENSWNGTVFERMGKNYEPMAVFAATFDGMPLLYSGMEAGMDKRLEFFEKDLIDWNGKSYAEFYRKLFQLKEDNKALWNFPHGGDVEIIQADEHVFIFGRQSKGERVIVALNFSKENQKRKMITDKWAGQYRDLFVERTVELAELYQFELGPHAYQVLHLND